MAVRKRRKMDIQKRPSHLTDKKYVSQFHVYSDSGAEYVISVRPDGGVMCSCPRWTHTRKQCKHINEFMATILHVNMGLDLGTYPFVIGPDSEHEGGKSLGDLLREQLDRDGDLVPDVLEEKPKKSKRPDVMDLLKSNASWGV